MDGANIKLDEIMANPSFRKALHIIGTVTFGYILLRLTLFILDTTHLGTAWLETHQDTGFFIIILILLSLILLMDHAISCARRNYGEEKHSIIDAGVTVAISNIEKYESKSPETIKPLIQKILTLSSTKETKPPEIVKPRSKVSDIIASELSGLSQKYQKEEPANPEVAVEAVEQKPVEIPAPVKEPEVIAAKVMKKEPPIVKKEGDIREFLKELIERPIARSEKIHKDSSKKQPTPASTLAESYKSSSQEDMIQSGEPLLKPIFKPGVTDKKEETEPKPGTSEIPELLHEIIKKAKPENYDDSNVIFSETIPIIVMKGKRVVKAFEANHSITIVDFKSKITQKNVKLTVESLNAPLQEAKSVKDGVVYEYNNIHINLDNEYIENAVVKFKVKRDWIIRNNINIMQLQQYIHDDWAVLPTTGVSQDARYLFFEVYIPSFSLPFAIVGM
jgi:PGF-pre-PGF domain-containing protein